MSPWPPRAAQPGADPAPAWAGWRLASTVSLLLVLLTVAAFAGVWQNGFVEVDDDEYVYTNAEVLSGLSLHGVCWAFTTFHAGNWHPLTWLSLQLDAELFGLNPAGYHITNLLLHCGSAVLLFLALWRLTGALGRAAVVAAFFAVHPLRVESVAWVAERKDILSGLFWMLTLLAYAWYAERPDRTRYLLTLLAFAVGLLAKPMLVTLPCVLVLLDFWPLRRARGLGADGVDQREKLPFFALAAVTCVLTLLAQEEAQPSLEALPLWTRVLNALVAYVTYLGKMLWPRDLAFPYPHLGTDLPLWKAGAAGLLLALISWAVLRAGRRCPYLAVGWLWYLGTLVPVIGLVQVGGQALADRYTYVPLVGLFLAIAWGLAHWAAGRPARRVLLGGATVALLAACVVATQAQVRHWQDTLTLWERAFSVHAEDPRMVRELLATYRKLEWERHDHWRAPAFQARYPRYAAWQNQLGSILWKHGEQTKAIRCFCRAAELDPELAQAALDLAAASPPESAERLRTALEGLGGRPRAE
jgi:protein O-mannosyl-transferase